MDGIVGKNALVTGASGGIGSAIARHLARSGAAVVVHYHRNAEAAEAVVASIESDGGRAFAVGAELGVPGDVDELFGAFEPELAARTGTTALDVLVNNAGVPSDTDPAEITPELFERTVAINAGAPLFLIQRALRSMPDGGRIINISSGLTRRTHPNALVHAMGKAALEQLTRHFAKHLAARGITVNTVVPGVTRNGNPAFDVPEVAAELARMSVFGRVGEPEDVANAVAFLAGDQARWITGSTVDATGGMLLG